MNMLTRIYRFYRDGFASMTIGRSLWLLIIIKVAIMFLVLKLFFFPDVISQQSQESGMDAGEVVRSNILDRSESR